ncbi:MAG: YicC family protein [Deltaproteobacteria bacterium]|nr:MAG: YicC family protein [Deltaproteobacteria bacterium]
MIKSMTAYGRAELQREGKTFECEIKTINHRYRDIHLRLPRNFQPLEEDLKGLLAKRIGRGRIEASIQVNSGHEQLSYHLQLNEPLVESYKQILKDLAAKFGTGPAVSLDTLCQLKDIIVYEPETPDIESLRPVFEEVLEQALNSLEQMRAREGQNIEKDFLERLDRIDAYVEEVEKLAAQIVEEYREKLKEKVSRIVGDVEVDEWRIAQEVAFLAERADITEEIVRIRSHTAQFREYLSIEEPVGRRLDFLIQEINREVNTLSTKASNATVSRIAVEIKGELERLREQAQNVE